MEKNNPDDAPQKLGEGTYGTVVFRNNEAWKIRKPSTEIGIPVDIIKETTNCNSPVTRKKSNVVKINKVRLTKRRFSFSMKPADGDLKSWYLKTSFDERIEKLPIIVKQLLFALKDIKEDGTIHRDIKPQNILYEEDGSKFKVKLTDFGISKNLPLAGKRLSADSFTIWYRPPEIAIYNTLEENHAYFDYSADMWAIGITIFELLTKVNIFQSNNVIELLNDMQYYLNYDKDQSEFIDDLFEGRIDKSLDVSSMLNFIYNVLPNNFVTFVSLLLINLILN